MIADTYNNRIQLCSAFSPGSPCQTVAGTGSVGSGTTQLHWPHGVAWVPRRTTSTTATTSSSQSTSFATTPSKSTEARSGRTCQQGLAVFGAGCAGVRGSGRALPRLIAPCVHGSSASCQVSPRQLCNAERSERGHHPLAKK